MFWCHFFQWRHDRSEKISEKLPFAVTCMELVLVIWAFNVDHPENKSNALVQVFNRKTVLIFAF